jgi:hypothetical protein
MTAMIRKFDIQVHSVHYKLDDEILHVTLHRIIVLTLLLNHHFIEATPVRYKPELCSKRVGYNKLEVMVDWGFEKKNEK